MLVELLTKEDLDNFRKELITEITQLFEKKIPLQKKWLKSYEVRKLLNMAPGTLQMLRNNKTIPYTKIGTMYYYAMEDIQQVMEKNRIRWWHGNEKGYYSNVTNNTVKYFLGDIFIVVCEGVFCQINQINQINQIRIIRHSSATGCPDLKFWIAESTLVKVS